MTGLLIGHTVVMVSVIAGLAFILASQPLIMDTLVILGSLYLLWVAFSLIGNPSSSLGSETHSAKVSRRWVLKGIGVSGLNPKVYLLLLALLPQFIDSRSSWPPTIQISVLGGLHLINCGLVYGSVSCSSRKLLQSRPVTARIISRCSGSAMIIITVLMLLEHFG